MKSNDLSLSTTLPGSDEPLLLSSAKRALLEALYAKHGPALLAFATSRLGDEHAAEDVVQNAFLAVLAGDAAFPAVDTVRVLRKRILKGCGRKLAVRSANRAAKRVRDEDADWRTWQRALASRRDPRNDEEDDQ